MPEETTVPTEEQNDDNRGEDYQDKVDDGITGVMDGPSDD